MMEDDNYHHHHHRDSIVDNPKNGDTTATATSTESSRTAQDKAIIINNLINQRTRHRQASQWRAADQIKRQLWRQYRIQVADHADGTTTWIQHVPKPVFSFTWSLLLPLSNKNSNATSNNNNNADKTTTTSCTEASNPMRSRTIPMIVCTVDNPHYRPRLADTMKHLQRINNNNECQQNHHHHRHVENNHQDDTTVEQLDSTTSSSSFSLDIESIDLIDLQKYQQQQEHNDNNHHQQQQQPEQLNLDYRNVLFEGWRTILLPYLMQKFSCETTATTTGIINHDNDDVDENNTADDAKGCADNTRRIHKVKDKRNAAASSPSSSSPSSSSSVSAVPSFILVAEDDVRLAVDSPQELQQACREAFDADESLDILSLGHAWRNNNSSSKSSSSGAGDSNNINGQDSLLLAHLQEGKKIHGTTLLAIRIPRGLQRLSYLMNAVTRNKKRTHLDQFLFHQIPPNTAAITTTTRTATTEHPDDLVMASAKLNTNVAAAADDAVNVPPPIALCDPPLAGWSEVQVTLTKPGTGQRRQGGGRKAHMPYHYQQKEKLSLCQHQEEEEEEKEEKEKDIQNGKCAETKKVKIQWIARRLVSSMPKDDKDELGASETSAIQSYNDKEGVD